MTDKKKTEHVLPSKRFPEDKEAIYRDVMDLIEIMSEHKIDGYVLYSWSIDDGYTDYGAMKMGSQNPYMLPTIVKKAIERWV